MAACCIENAWHTCVYFVIANIAVPFNWWAPKKRLDVEFESAGEIYTPTAEHMFISNW